MKNRLAVSQPSRVSVRPCICETQKSWTTCSAPSGAGRADICPNAAQTATITTAISFWIFVIVFDPAFLCSSR